MPLSFSVPVQSNVAMSGYEIWTFYVDMQQGAMNVRVRAKEGSKVVETTEPTFTFLEARLIIGKDLADHLALIERDIFRVLQAKGSIPPGGTIA